MAKLPNHAKCVFKGILFDTYQWEQKLPNGSFTTFEMLRRKHAVSVIAIKDDSVYYVEECYPGQDHFTGLIRGCANNYEDNPLDTAKRELLEESGMVSNDWSLILETNSHPFIDCPIYIYVAKNCNKISTQELDASENIKVCSTDIDDFCNNILNRDNFQSKHPLKEDMLNSMCNDNIKKLKKILEV